MTGKTPVDTALYLSVEELLQVNKQQELFLLLLQGQIQNLNSLMKTIAGLHSPGGLKLGIQLKNLSGFIGSCSKVFNGCRINAFPSHVLSHGPPPVSKAHISLVVSNKVCNKQLGFRHLRTSGVHGLHGKHEQVKAP